MRLSGYVTALSMALYLFAGAAIWTASCSTVGKLGTVSDMTEDEFGRYSERLGMQVALVARAAYDAGDVSADGLTAVANALDGLASGTAAGGGMALLDYLNLDGYGAAALAIVIVEVDTSLETSGAYDDGGVLNERGRAVLETIAAKLREVAVTGGGA